MQSSEETVKKKEIFTYQAPWCVFGLAWSQRTATQSKFRLAIGSFIEEYTNKVQIIQHNDESNGLEKVTQFNHPYPATKIMWSPVKDSEYDSLATTGDYLRIWKVADDGTVEEPPALLNNNSKSEYCAPLTSFDWNETDPNMIGTSSIDTTCTIWDRERGVATTQLIAHDKEVYDIAFAQGKNVFASVGADGSVRLFDLRNLEHSTITYESEGFTPLLRLVWNKQDPNYLATILADSPKAIILDIRMPSTPVSVLGAHTSAVNSIAWAPHSARHLCTCGDDKSALIWDLKDMPKPINDPILAYNAEDQVNQLQWSAAQPEWISIAFGKKVQMLRV
jgi:WD repeat-containing protein 68